MRVKLVIFTGIAAANFARGQYGPISPQPDLPFSADQILTQVLILPDGKHVTQPEQTSKLYRDSMGRSRMDVYFKPVSGAQRGQPTLMNITIFDPIEGARYLLNPGKKTVQKFSLPKRSELPKPPTLAELLAMDPGPAIQAGSANEAPDPHAPPPSQNESLGTQTMEGITAVGRRTTMRFPAGTIGNDREIVTVFEAWESPELGMMMVMTKNSDPRSGELSTKLTNIRLAEPDPSLFVVPSEYTMQEPSGPVRPKPAAAGSVH
jgi:hypothetical protein